MSYNFRYVPNVITVRHLFYTDHIEMISVNIGHNRKCISIGPHFDIGGASLVWTHQSTEGASL